MCEREKRKSTSFSLLYLCFICTMTSKWLQCYCALFMGVDLNLVSLDERKTIIGLSVCARSETRDFKVVLIEASSVFMWITGIATLPLLLCFLNMAVRIEYFCEEGIHYP